MKIPRRVGGGVFRARQSIFEREQVLRFEADPGLQQLVEAANEQARGDEQKNGERDLRDDETAAQTIPARAFAAAASTFLESAVQVGLRHLQRGGEAKEPSGQDRNR